MCSDALALASGMHAVFCKFYILRGLFHRHVLANSYDPIKDAGTTGIGWAELGG